MVFKTSRKVDRGREAEERAVRYLKRRGYEVLTRNFRVRSGEIDIIALKKKEFVFVEVRLRGEGGMVTAAESVTLKKQKRIVRAAKAYLAKYPKVLDRFSIRFDVITFDGRRVEHHKDCFGLD